MLMNMRVKALGREVLTLHLSKHGLQYPFDHGALSSGPAGLWLVSSCLGTGSIILLQNAAVSLAIFGWNLLL